MLRVLTPDFLPVAPLLLRASRRVAHPADLPRVRSAVNAWEAWIADNFGICVR